MKSRGYTVKLYVGSVFYRAISVRYPGHSHSTTSPAASAGVIKQVQILQICLVLEFIYGRAREELSPYGLYGISQSHDTMGLHVPVTNFGDTLQAKQKQCLTLCQKEARAVHGDRRLLLANQCGAE